MLVQIMMKNIKIRARADPDQGLYSLPKNFNSITSPMSVFSFPPNILEIINELISGANTIKKPDKIPGELKGNVILQNMVNLFAPKSLAASITFLSIFEREECIGRIMYGKQL